MQSKKESWRLWARAMALAATALALSGCASFYVDGSTPEVPAAQFKKPVPLKPVQLLFQFQTKGVANERATVLLKDLVEKQVRESGLFLAVSGQAVEGAPLLTVTLNNVPLTDDAFSKGFVTGLTFGLAGSQVSDGYVLTLQYAKGVNGPLQHQARHAIHTVMGAAPAPGNATQVANLDEAAKTMLRQVLSQGLKQLSDDPAFN